MTPRPTRIIRGALLKKGFAEEEYGDHKKLRLYVDGERTRIHTRYTGRLRYRTVNSHGARECDNYILGQMALHLRLSRAQLDDLVDCTMSAEEYVKLLRERGEIKA
jgi:hypothetical protein